MTVYLVGAGPGDPALLTARALELIAAADVIVHDRLIPPEALGLASPRAELIYAGKEGGGESASQAEIERLLIERGRDPEHTIVRLKGGDPFVFGRGGEEAEALRAAGVPFEVVPGVTAGVAAPAYGGIPVTHRGLASAVAFVTGHEDPDKPTEALDWSALASFPGTLVVYMGLRQLDGISKRLTEAGRDPAEPAAVIERGASARQRVVTATLETIATAARTEGIRPPALAVIGRVVELRDRISWFELRPLSGIMIAVTRARAQASALAARLRGLGAAAIETPAIRIEPIDGPAPDLGAYDLVCLTSPNGVRLLLERLYAAGRDARGFAGVTVAAIGPGTAAALRQHGVVADVVPGVSTAEGLLDALAGRPAGRALVARARDARDVLPEGLRQRGAEVDVLALYETVAEALSAEQLEALTQADYVTFTSSSTVTRLLEATGGGGLERARLVSIGPVTSATLRKHGLEPDVEAAVHDIDGLVDALLADVEARLS